MIIWIFHFVFHSLANAVKGPWLNISKVSRLHMAAYLCIASNNVPPSVSKRIKLDVQCKYNVEMLLTQA